MRRGYDSTNAADIPPSAEMVAGYIDGRYRWLADDWLRFPDAVKVRIAVFASTNDGDVLDVEWGDSTPEEVPGWLTMRRATGADPSVYVNRSNWQAVRDECARAGVAEPHYWLAAYDGVAEVLAGTVAKQYANEAITGVHYDLSAVADFWPGVDGGKAMTPKYCGESVTQVNVTVGEVAFIDTMWDYGAGPRAVQFKVYASRAGMWPVLHYPPADPDADPTLDLAAQPGLFIVAAR